MTRINHITSLVLCRLWTPAPNMRLKPRGTDSPQIHAEPAPSERTNNGVSVQKKDAEEEFLEKLIFGDAEGFEDGLNEVNGGDSDDSDEGGIALVGDGDGNEDAGADLQALQDDELFFVDEEPSDTAIIPSESTRDASHDSSDGKERKIFQHDKTPMTKCSPSHLLTGTCYASFGTPRLKTSSAGRNILRGYAGSLGGSISYLSRLLVIRLGRRRGCMAQVRGGGGGRWRTRSIEICA
ncbi:hypothetical protein HOY82DRAFT_592122 [Tuber indicum]|nr:hypothetical protein HOY82DRAFT_592122 [Tuber indicum]